MVINYIYRAIYRNTNIPIKNLSKYENMRKEIEGSSKCMHQYETSSPDLAVVVNGILFVYVSFMFIKHKEEK